MKKRTPFVLAMVTVCVALGGAAVAAANGPPVTVTVLPIDETTRGNWPGTYGECFYLLPDPQIDFVEDPIPWDPGAWNRLREAHGIPLAADRDLETRADEADWLVVKPAVINSVVPGEIAHAKGLRLVFTSYLDHAVGQLYAAWRAAECAPIFGPQLGACGLLTHGCFEPDPFFEQLECEGSRLVPPHGTGLGFDDLLEALPWKPLN